MSETPKVVSAPQPSFDLGHLADLLKEQGLPHAEGLAKAALDAVFDWIEYGVKTSESKVDDFAMALLPPLKQFVFSKLETISASPDQPAS